MLQFTGRRKPISISGAGKVVDGILRQRPCFFLAPWARLGVRAPARYRALISANFACARANFSLNSHIASMISRKVADVRARSACPKANTLLLRRYFMTVGSETLVPSKLPDLSADLVGD